MLPKAQEHETKGGQQNANKVMVHAQVLPLTLTFADGWNMHVVTAHNASFAWSTRFKRVGGRDMIPSLFEGRERVVLPPAGAVSICFLVQCSRAVLRGFGRPGVFSYSDRVVLEPILRRLAAELDLFPALVPVPKNSLYSDRVVLEPVGFLE